MDADDLRDFKDQYPYVPPSSTANVWPYARFLSNMPDWIDMYQDAFNKAFSALPLSLEGPPPHGCSIHATIQASISIFGYNFTPHSTFISYLISYPISYLIYVTLISYPISGPILYMIFGTGPIGSTVGRGSFWNYHRH